MSTSLILILLAGVEEAREFVLLCVMNLEVFGVELELDLIDVSLTFRFVLYKLAAAPGEKIALG